MAPQFADQAADEPLGAAVHERHLRLTDKNRSHDGDYTITIAIVRAAVHWREMRRFVAVTTEVALLLCGLTLVAIAATYPLIRHMTTHLPGDLGDPVLVAWILAWDADAFRHGVTRIFDAPSFFPYLHTLVYSEHMLGVAVFTAPLQWLSARPVLRLQHRAFIASSVQAGAGMYLLARTLTGRRDAALLAALAYAFTPVARRPDRPSAMADDRLAAAQPLGAAPLFLDGRPRLLLASAAAYVLQSLTGSYFTYFALLPLAAVAIAETWRVRPPLRRTLIHSWPPALLCGLTLAPVVSAYYRAREDHDFRRSPAEIVQLSADLGRLLSRPQSRAAVAAPWGNGEHELFPGAIVLVLAGAAWFTARGGSTSQVRVYTAIAATTLVLSLGPRPAAWGHIAPIPGPYQILLNHVPGLDGLRAVSRSGMMMVALALSVLVRARIHPHA